MNTDEHHHHLLNGSNISHTDSWRWSSLSWFICTSSPSWLQEFLRSLPNCLLDTRLYNKWVKAVNCENNCESRARIKSLLKKLPEENLLLLRHVLYVLKQIALRSAENKMCSRNLAVCIGPSLLQPSSPIATFSASHRDVSLTWSFHEHHTHLSSHHMSHACLLIIIYWRHLLDFIHSNHYHKISFCMRIILSLVPIQSSSLLISACLSFSEKDFLTLQPPHVLL